MRHQLAANSGISTMICTRLKTAISSQAEIAIIGAGIVDLATGLGSLPVFPIFSLAVIEKERTVASLIAGSTSAINGA
jgi:hypothetical protein